MSATPTIIFSKVVGKFHYVALSLLPETTSYVHKYEVFENGKTALIHSEVWSTEQGAINQANLLAKS